MSVNQIKVVSFDAEGTLATTRFSQSIWYEGIPTLYARKTGLDLEDARVFMTAEYNRLGTQAPEWYDIQYWLERFDLGDYHQLLDKYRHQISHYPDVEETLATLGENYELIVSSATAREFLEPILENIEGHFAAIFSSISDYRKPKVPNFYRAVCHKMHVEPREMVHVGDTFQSDFTAPREVGIEAFHLDRDGAESGQDGTIKDLRELVMKLK